MINNNLTDQPLETEELVNSFKYKYEDLKYIFDLKIKEMHIAENNYREILKKFQFKLEELEDLNTQLKNLVIAKENEIAQLHQTILIKDEENKNSEKILQEKLSNLVKEKEDLINDLNNKIKILKGETKGKNFSVDELFREEFKNTKEELEKLKEKFVKKYNYIKEKYYILKHHNKEKDLVIQVI